MTDSYTFNTPIGFLTIREEEKKLTKLFWEANSVQTTDHSNLEGDRGCGTQLQILRIFMVFTVSDPACGALPSYLSADQQ